ncbi:PRP3-domain-containing protein [Xylariaceae sp. AK1471]|nr:PRP3-domain-containing protein [Xylariaceae sp. AK1471]
MQASINILSKGIMGGAAIMVLAIRREDTFYNCVALGLFSLAAMGHVAMSLSATTLKIQTPLFYPAHAAEGSRPAGSLSRRDQEHQYYDASLGAPTAKPRQSRKLVFNQKGKHIQQANALRRQAALEALKIAAWKRKAGIDEDIDVEKNFVIEASLDIKWWDEGLVNGKNCDDIDNPDAIKSTPRIPSLRATSSTPLLSNHLRTGISLRQNLCI